MVWPEAALPEVDYSANMSNMMVITGRHVASVKRNLICKISYTDQDQANSPDPMVFYRLPAKPYIYWAASRSLL